jgi:hypothetical protein
MAIARRTPKIRLRPHFLIALAFGLAGCRGPDPLLTFLDPESSLSFTHPPHWNVGFAEQDGLRYRYLTAPKVEGDAGALSVTLISPTEANSAELVAKAYLTGATTVLEADAAPGIRAWTFLDSSGASSRLWIRSAGNTRFLGAWARGSEKAMNQHSGRLDSLFASLAEQRAGDWPQERFGGMVARAPASWARGTRLSNATNAMMQFRSPPLAVDKGTDTIHGFVTLSREPVPPPGDIEAFSGMLKDRVSDTAVLLEHRPWTPAGADGGATGYADYLRSGTTLTATRSRRWTTVRNGMGLIFSCEARADAFDRLEPWCLRMAATVRLE